MPHSSIGTRRKLISGTWRRNRQRRERSIVPRTASAHTAALRGPHALGGGLLRGKLVMSHRTSLWWGLEDCASLCARLVPALFSVGCLVRKAKFGSPSLQLLSLFLRFAFLLVTKCLQI
ncbi:hypothetical protein BDZ91DRAFT_722444 [Kalaharituber pfeilii]|nr:hypothetical protein BDZ91DRAFT_722444 [Kalaharituber pfeilii]